MRKVMKFLRMFFTAVSVTVAAPVFAQSDPPVKMSVSGICHQKGKSPYYAQTKKFTAYNTLDECLKSGGRMPAK
jgi:hypothetical protein